MGLVFRADDTRLLRRVALKFLSPSLARDPVAKERFLIEARTASALDHPNIATVYELGEIADGQLFLAMAYYEGETLGAKIKSGPRPVDEAVLLADQVAAGLCRAHQRGIVHRDIKPSNLMITTDGIVKILDFGIAKLAGQEGLTREGAVVGTLAYMSPEQASGKGVDHRTDIWSLGVVLYSMLAGCPPFRGENDGLLVHAIVHRRQEPLRSVRPEVPAELEQLVERMLAKDPAERPQSMTEVRASLGVSSVSREVPQVPSAPRPARRIRRGAAGAAAAILVAALAVFALWPTHGRQGMLPRNASRVRPSIAVLPFANLSRDAAQDYMADGLTESLTTDLAKLGGLKVVSRTSTMVYRTAAKPLPQIASELGVDDVLEGSVLRVGGRVRITAKLVEARTDRSLWAESYDREMSDILELQSDVSRAIARATQVQLTPQELARLAPARTIQPEVYEAYLKGRYQWNRRNKEGLRQAITFFEQAIAKDPSFAPAYTGLSDSYGLLAILGDSSEAAKARAAAQQALALDEALPEAHASLGFIHLVYDWDWAGTERELRRALDLNPSYATAHHWYAVELCAVGRFQEGQREIEVAHELDPLSSAIDAEHALQLDLMGQRDAAEAKLHEILRRDPGFDRAWLHLTEIMASEGRLAEAAQAYRQSLSARGLGSVAQEMARTRDRSVAQAAFGAAAQSLGALAPDLSVSTVEVAWLFAVAGQRDRAFEWLEKAYQQRAADLVWLGAGRNWENLHGDPRYEDLLRRIGLPLRWERPGAGGLSVRTESQSSVAHSRR